MTSIIPELNRTTPARVAMDLVRNPDTDSATLGKLYALPHLNLTRLCAKHPNATADQLHDWSDTDDLRILTAIARHRNLGAATIFEMIQDSRERVEDIRVAVDVRGEKHLVPSLNAAKRAESKLRLSLAKHPAVNAGALGSLTRDTSVFVRYAAAEHPKTPTADLQALAADMRRVLAGPQQKIWKVDWLTPDLILDAAEANLDARGVDY